MLKTTGNHHTESIEASFDIVALNKAPTDSARYAVAMKASEEETPPLPRLKKSSDLLPSQRDVWLEMSPAERLSVFEKKSNGLMAFMVDKLKFTKLELE